MRGLHNLSYQRNSVYGLTIALLFHLSLIATYYLTSSFGGGVVSIPKKPPIWIGLPPSPSIINNEIATSLNIKIPEVKATVGIPIPVPDIEISPDKTIATQKEISDFTTSTIGDINRDGDVTFVPKEIIPEEVDPDANIFIPFEVGPKLIKQVAPEYPDIARRAGVEGTVWVNCLVGKDGRVKKAIVMKSDADIFNEPAIEAALQWLFTPALMKNGPVTVWASVPFKFQLNK
jgi:protein TonB